jgi:hypothetical protein
MMLRKRQSWTVVWEKPTLVESRRGHPGRVKITASDTGKVVELLPGDMTDVDCTLYLTPMEGGWELLP